ncbi:MAG: FkbM family methyltransferase [Verrucomicrobiales bacterium]
MRFKLPLEKMSLAFRSRFFFDAYEEEERAMCKKYLQDTSSVLELGGCIGIVSCVANARLASGTKHVVIEANPELIPWLKLNREVNRAQFSVEHGMLSRTSDGAFHVGEYIVSGSANSDAGELVKVPVFEIEKVCEKYRYIPEVVLMDIEGGEVDFFRENEHWIRDCKTLKTMIIEMHPFIVGEAAVDEVVAILTRLGFRRVERRSLVEVWQR